MSIQFGDILQHNNPNFPISDVTDIKGGLRSIATFSDASLISEYTSGAGGTTIPEKYKTGYSLMLERSTGTIYYLSGISATNSSHWSTVGIGGNATGMPFTIPKWTTSSTLGNSNITDNGDTITINGNLMVIGTTSTISSQNLLVKDPIILLAASQSGTPIYDAGLFVNRGSSDTQAFIWDESDKEFKFISTISDATTSGNVVIGSYSNVRTGALKVSSILIADGTQGPNKLLISDTSGLASWITASYITDPYLTTASASTTYYSLTNPSAYITASALVPYLTIASASTSFYVKGGSTYSFDTTSSIYRKGSLSIGTGSVDSNDRFVVSSTTGTVSLIVDEFGSVYNRGRGGTATNTAFGFMALGANTTGNRNTAFGASALSLNTTGSFNTAVGQQSLMSNLIGSSNTAVGHQSLQNNINSNNTAIGINSLKYNTTGISNTAIGSNSLYSNTTTILSLGTITPGSGYASDTYSEVQLIYATGSTAITYPKATIVVDGTGGVISVVITSDGQGFQNTTTRMTAILGISGSGFEVGISTLVVGSNNTATGFFTLYNNTSGTNNTAFGYQSLYSNTNGYQNTAIGQQSLYSNTTGWGSIAIGQNSLYSNTIGDRNTSIGHVAMRYYKGLWSVGLGGVALGAASTGIKTLSATFSPGQNYTPGTYSDVRLFYSSGAYWNAPNSDGPEYPTAEIVVGAGGTVSSVTLKRRGVLLTDTTTRFGVQTGTQSYQLGTASGTGFSIGIATLATANYNTAIGYGALANMGVGNENIAIGMWAGLTYGPTAAGELTGSDQSIFIGRFASPLYNNSVNEIVIGNEGRGNGSNTITFGNDSIITTYLKGNIVSNITTNATSSAAYSITNTWNTTLNTTGLLLNVIPTLAGSASNIFDFRLNGTSQLYLSGVGTATYSSGATAVGILTSTKGIRIEGDTNNNSALSFNVNSAGIIMNNVADETTNREYNFIRWVGTNPNRTFQIINASSNTGIARPLLIGVLGGSIGIKFNPFASVSTTNTTGAYIEYNTSSTSAVCNTGLHKFFASAVNSANTSPLYVFTGNFGGSQSGGFANVVITSNVNPVGGTGVTGSRILLDVGTNTSTTGTYASHSSLFNVNSGGRVTMSGNSGNGGLVLPITTTASVTGATAGLVIYDSVSNTMQIYNGTTWITYTIDVNRLFNYASNTYQTSSGTLTATSPAMSSSMFTTGDVLRIQSIVTLNSQSVGTVSTIYYINSTASIVGAIQIASYDAVASQRYIWVDRTLWTISGSFYTRNFSGGQSSVNVNSSTIGSVAIPSTFYILVTATTTGSDLACISSVVMQRS